MNRAAAFNKQDLSLDLLRNIELKNQQSYIYLYTDVKNTNQ